MQPLDGVKTQLARPAEEVIGNIRRNSARGLLEAHELPEWREIVPLAVVGGGPSLKQTADVLRRYKYIMACGSVHDWLVHNGIAPRWTVIVDADPVMARYLASPIKGCTYLVASQCHDAVFDALKGFHTVLWHAGDGSINKEIWGEDEKVLIGGGCTVGTRAIAIALTFGYRNLHLFGFDTCVPDAETHHAYGFATDEEDIGDLSAIRLGGPDGKEFLMAGYHVAQLFDFKEMIKGNASRARFTVHGGGALAEILRLGREMAQTHAVECGGPSSNQTGKS